MLMMELCAFQMAWAHSKALPVRREIKNATLVHSVGNSCGCISINRATCSRKPLQSTASPKQEAGMAMGLMAFFHCMVRHGTVQYGSLLGGGGGSTGYSTWYLVLF